VPDADPADAFVRTLLARCTFPAPGTAVTCAVSGGADSLALLVLAARAGLGVTAVHVDHGLRTGSAAEAQVVGAAAVRFGAGFRAERVAVEPGPNLEARARAARYAVLPVGALTGHTLDDQAETVLLNLLWGAGPEGLAAMRHDGPRPLLALRRAETVALCAALDLEPVHDPSNDDRSLRRNRVRHELLPLLADIAARDPAPVLARQAAVFRQVTDLLDDLAAPLDVTDARALTAAPPAVAAAAVRRWLRPYGDGLPPDRASVERVLGVARGDNKATEVAGGWRVARTAGRLRLEPPPTAE
jgi:tRNA(Ile)-lysidine synthase